MLLFLSSYCLFRNFICQDHGVIKITIFPEVDNSLNFCVFEGSPPMITVALVVSPLFMIIFLT